ncbi:trypsin-like peptidase domain-containing protein [Candidatus Nomurabacteria bacterium]|uniref:Trypsin-like peptidase domain-containing protein n=1 Tax=candidate division WWE3 bacterium TaxID=2053526 RepID=A0A955IVS4_UNCKA|nr:trypsin-like peptidase domain-containing protein [candidate division WWE3 bacterium]MCB9823680.1 trypsin-like peptidase domain-containing protein [Candidatus Nomurabacteria bacterium]MCB9827242.1 trypsin-like peptidase domain-containing protein [Candidatus Nomurabacteria bacterium]MCB9827475.1 trypsin-like peptidase domain-containing protein [Candidatus Nomurabacteria bacterium]HXK52995.1 trypsin-like peptidase domain-containing protein [bacterium]
MEQGFISRIIGNSKRFIKGFFWFGAFLSIVLAAFFYNRSAQKSDHDLEVPARQKIILQNKDVEEESALIQMIDKVSPSVVSIVVKTTGFDIFNGSYSVEDGIGTGFIVDEKGLIVTNDHVVDSVKSNYAVVTSDGTTYDVKRISKDPYADLAILEIDASGLPVVELGDSSILRLGQTAVAIGNALGTYDNTVTSGVVSGIARQVVASLGFGDSKTYEDVIQTDAALNPGNSGGPLLNLEGQVIGINVATIWGAENIGFAIPVNTLKPLLEVYMSEGRLIRPYLGVSYNMVSKNLAELRDLPEGAFILSVSPNSPAEEGGLRRGDIIIKIDDVNITESSTLSAVIANKRVGDKLTIRVVREDEELEISVVLAEFPDTSVFE